MESAQGKIDCRTYMIYLIFAVALESLVLSVYDRISPWVAIVIAFKI